MITIEEAFALLKIYNKDPFHIQHALTIEAVMKWYKQIVCLNIPDDYSYMDDDLCELLESVVPEYL